MQAKILKVETLSDAVCSQISYHSEGSNSSETLKAPGSIAAENFATPFVPMVCEMTASYTADRLEESAVPAYQNSEGSIHLSVRLQLVR